MLSPKRLGFLLWDDLGPSPAKSFQHRRSLAPSLQGGPCRGSEPQRLLQADGPCGFELFVMFTRLPMKHTRSLLLAVLLCAQILVTACSGHKSVKLPASSPPSSELQAYSLDELLVHHEGLRLNPYYDTASKLSIGVGRNLSDTGISEEEAMFLLHNDIGRINRTLDAKLPWWRGLSETRRKVLVSMAFNLGVAGLLQFTNMLSALEDGDYAAAAEHMLASRWAQQVGNRALELAYLMENG